MVMVHSGMKGGEEGIKWLTEATPPSSGRSTPEVPLSDLLALPDFSQELSYRNFPTNHYKHVLYYLLHLTLLYRVYGQVL